MKRVHEKLVHPGSKRAIEYARKYYFWPSMEKDITGYCKSCRACQLVKIDRSKKPGALQPIAVPENPTGSHMHRFCGSSAYAQRIRFNGYNHRQVLKGSNVDTVQEDHHGGTVCANVLPQSVPYVGRTQEDYHRSRQAICKFVLVDSEGPRGGYDNGIPPTSRRSIRENQQDD